MLRTTGITEAEDELDIGSYAPFNGVTENENDLGLGMQMENVVSSQHPGLRASLVAGEERPLTIVKEVARASVP